MTTDTISMGASRARVAELAAKGMHASAIARELGVSRQRVHQIVNQLGIELPNFRKTALEKRRALEAAVNSPRLKGLFAQYVAAEIDREQFCKELSIPESAFYEVLRKAGLLTGSIKELNVARRKNFFLHQRIYHWTVIGYLDDEDYLDGDFRNHKVQCRCDCGTETGVLLNSIIRGASPSCFKCAVHRRRVVPWSRSDGKRFPNSRLASIDAGVTPAVFGIRIKDGSHVYRSANGFTYTALMDEARPYVKGWKNQTVEDTTNAA